MPIQVPGLSRRDALKTVLAASVGLGWLGRTWPVAAQEPGERPEQDGSVTVLNPRDRVPMSFIIDDSCCLVNLAHFCIPQFAEVFPDRYLQDWKNLPREIPDTFVRKFGEWCREHEIKGKFSVLPNPALVGWVDREMPGWSKRELLDSLKLVREFMQPNWDIHPEMITHTWAINTKTGRPFEERTEKQMENWGWSVGMSVDQMADYVAYALRILKNAGLYCEGVTTPGGFGNRSRESLAQGTLQACRDVYQTEIPHYFRHLFTDDRSVAPRVEYASGLDTDDPKCVVSVIGCTGDWFGGWDGLTPGSVDRFITDDLKGGRLPQVIDKGEPAILVCHWPGIYYNGEEVGFDIFKEVVRRLNARYNNLIWMKNSEIARYWAARELTTIEKTRRGVRFRAPFGTPNFTVEIARSEIREAPSVKTGKEKTVLNEVKLERALVPGTFVRARDKIRYCFDLPKGTTELTVG